MLTKLEYRTILLVLNVATKLGVSPFKLSPQKKLVFSRYECIIRKLHWIVILVFIYNISFLLQRIVHQIESKQLNRGIVNGVLFFGVISAIVVVVNIRLYAVEFRWLVNGLLTRYENSETTGENKVREYAFVCTVFLLANLSLGSTVLFTLMNTDAFSWFELLIYSAFTTPACAMVWITFGMQVTCLILSLQQLTFWIGKASVDWPMREHGHNDLKSVYDLSLSTYRVETLINSLHNTTFGNVFLPCFKLLFACILFLATFVVIRLYKAIHPFLFIVCLMYSAFMHLFLLPGALLMSKIYSISSEFRVNMSRCFIEKIQFKEERMQMRTEINSFPTLRSKVGSFYFMERKAKLTLLNQILNGTTCMLITFK